MGSNKKCSNIYISSVLKGLKNKFNIDSTLKHWNANNFFNDFTINAETRPFWNRCHTCKYYICSNSEKMLVLNFHGENKEWFFFIYTGNYNSLTK